MRAGVSSTSERAGIVPADRRARCGGSGRPTCSARRRSPEAIERVRALQREAGDVARSAGRRGDDARRACSRCRVTSSRHASSYACGAQTFYRSAGMAVSAAGVALHGAWIEQRAGDDARAESVPARGTRASATRSASGVLLDGRGSPRAVPLHAGPLRRDAGDVARSRARRARPAISSTSSIADAVEGCVLAHEGRHEEAEALLGRAVERRRDDRLLLRACRRRGSCIAEVLVARGRAEAAASAAARSALALLDDKGDVTGAARARERLDELGIATRLIAVAGRC